MDELKQKAIKRHYANLVKCMNPLYVMDHLAHLLSLEDMELIRDSSSRPDKNRALLTMLFRQGEELKPFECFVEALKKTNQNHGNLAKDIIETYEHENGGVLADVPRTSLPAGEKTEHGLQIAQQSLEEMYLTRFRKVRPFSLPFMFDIKNTWVSLALKEEKYSQATEDHAKLLEQAFKKSRMLTIEGDPATGKTSLMRRLAYEWAIHKNRKSKFMQLKKWVREKLTGGIQLLCYDLVLYSEFREVRMKNFESIAELVLYYSKKYLSIEGYENLKNLVNNEKFCKEYRILVLLDGYDESSLEQQCSELSSYINEQMIKKALLFNTVVTTRKGYLSTYRGVKGRLVFAEVLGFSTIKQKEKYISNHFFSEEIDNKEKITAVHNLLTKNGNLNKLAETPLFLTFICLVYEKIVDGTLLELYCNIIRWLIDRHQQDNPDRDVPSLFGYQSDSVQTADPSNIRQKQDTIQNHYLQFPQLLSLGKMALMNLKKNVFQGADFTEFDIKSIIHQVGLIRKDEFYDQSWNLTSTYSFPHRTIQEFLAAFYWLCSSDPTGEWLQPNSQLNTAKYGRMKEFEWFLFRIALSDKMPVQTEKLKYYFERTTEIDLDMTFDAFNTTAGFNNELLNWFLSQCTNVQYIKLHGEQDTTVLKTNMYSTVINNKWAVTSKMPTLTLLSFSDLIKLHSVSVGKCTFEADSQLTFTNCASLNKLRLWRCEMKSCTIVGIATLPAIQTVEFDECSIDLATWQSITDKIRNSSVTCLQLSADFFVKATYLKFLHHLQECERIQQIYAKGVEDGYEEEVTANLVLTAEKLPGLKSITISDRFGTLPVSNILNERNLERIEKAGQQRNSHFSIEYVEWSAS